MNWKDLKLSGKFTVGFGSIILILIIAGSWSFLGIRGILNDANQVIDGRNLRVELNSLYVQHLKWVDKVGEFLSNDQIHHLDVELDHTKCNLGKWIGGPQKEEAIKMVPELKDVTQTMEGLHEELHASARQIKNEYRKADRFLSNDLNRLKADYLNWSNNIIRFRLGNSGKRIPSKLSDANNSQMGLWLKSEKAANLKQENDRLDKWLTNCEAYHARVHYLAAINTNSGVDYINSIQSASNLLLTQVDSIIEWNDNNLNGANSALNIYFGSTKPILAKLGNLFSQADKISKEKILSDEQMFKKAYRTELGIVIFCLLAVGLAILISSIISKGIIKPLLKAVKFTKSIEEGNLNVNLSMNRKDEVGILTLALDNMVSRLKKIVSTIQNGAQNISSASVQLSTTSQQLSQSANQQASLAEQVSSSMEQMAANIEQNTDHANQTESISVRAAERIATSNESVETSVNAMNEIAEKINVINDIAFQTNILALNAAVEAARAGDYGKGFAVVASEVRKLAERAKEAADEIDVLSKNGVDVSLKAGVDLAEIVPEIEKTSVLVQEISAASREQKSGANLVNNAVNQLSGTTQQNATVSEELAANAEELSAQAQHLSETVAFFKLESTALISGKQPEITQLLEENQQQLIQPESTKTEKKELEVIDSGGDEQFESF